MAGTRESICEGLLERITIGLHLGRLHSGERLGSAREAARESGVGYRRIVAALRGLERDGLLEIRPRGGIYAGGRERRSDRDPLRRFGERLADAVVDALDDGLAIGAVAERLRGCLETSWLRVACVECNQDQLDFLHHELGAGFGLESAGVEIEQLRGVPPLAVRQAHLLVTTSFHAGEVRRFARRLGKGCIVVVLDPRRRADVMRALAERPVYFIGTDPRWAAKARRIWAGEPGAERLQILTLGTDALEGIPPEAAVMLMPCARRLLAGSALAERALPPRGFSVETRRQIVAFVVGANAAAHGRAGH